MKANMRYSALFLALLNSANVAAQALSPDTKIYTGDGAWSPYLVGALIGVLAWLTFYFSEKQIGASSFYATVAGFIGKAIAPKHTMKLAYYQEKPPAINWEFAFVVSIIFGSALAAISGGEFSLRGIPQLWTDHYGDKSGLLYTAVSFSGGLLMAFGARLAGGCTSGHGISGTLQLSVSSWITVICIFLSGVIAVKVIY
jgi:hypothetical protein